MWADGPGVLELPDGRRVRGRGLRAGVPDGDPPDFGLYLLGKEPPETPWPARWVRWPDFRLPADPADARAALVEAYERSATERVDAVRANLLASVTQEMLAVRPLSAALAPRFPRRGG